MQTRKSKPTGFMPFCKKNRVKIITATALLFSLGSNIKSFAALKIHEWKENHRGYSIELVPGTGGTTGSDAEYVAAGTVYDANRPLETSWHFMHLDKDGTILSSRISQLSKHQLRVVDIVPQSNNEYRIIVSSRVTQSPLARDFVYIHGVDINGTDLSAAQNPDVSIFSDELCEQRYKNLYPTHAYYASDNKLYMVGYATENTQYPSEPNNNYTDKISWSMMIDINAPAPVPVSYYFWNTGSGANGTDYDMPLRIAPHDYYNDFPLLVTGAMNTDGATAGNCGIFVGKLYSGSGVTFGGGVAQSGLTPNPSKGKGIYGVDIRGDIGHSIGGVRDIVVLVNSFDDASPNDMTWGVVRIKDNLTTYPPTHSSFIRYRGTPGWANQFLELHTQGYNNPSTYNHIYVVGQQVKVPTCGGVSSPSLNPSLTNVNPFIAYAVVGDDNWTLPPPANPGYYNGTAFALRIRYTYLSSVGTDAVNMNYLPGSLTYGSALEDVSRLYTFASVDHYYDDPTAINPPQAYPGLLSPIGEKPAASNLNLRTKFLGLSTGFAEQDCVPEAEDCVGTDDYFATENTGEFTSELHYGVSAYHDYNIDALFNNGYIPNQNDCASSGGTYYRTSGNGNSGNATTNNNNDVMLFPNPASTIISVESRNVITENNGVDFVMADITGKEVFKTKTGHKDSRSVNVEIPKLAAGVYICNISIAGEKFSKRITIK